MADQAWRAFREEMKKKRCTKNARGTGKEQKNSVNSTEELTVQRLSAQVTGKAQKYARVGPREFVNFKDRELTIENIKEACSIHFGSRVAGNCDILAGEQGPSCRTIKQIPNVNLIHVRFVEEREDGTVESVESDDSCQALPVRKKFRSESPVRPRPVSESKPVDLPPKKPRENCPRSLTVSAMLKLGRVVDATATLVKLYAFSMETMTWSNLPLLVEFVISESALGEGAFRKAYRASSTTKGFSDAAWVIKRYKPAAVKEIQEINQSEEAHTKKVVQMHHLARNFAYQLHEKVLNDDDLNGTFGKTLQYKNIFLGTLPDGEFVTVEEFLEGVVVKHINNDGLICGDSNDEICQKAQCLSHFSYEKSNGEVMIVDIQGCGYNLFDPEIASTLLIDTHNCNELMFTTGNLSTAAITTFVECHTCNVFCKCLGLQPLT